jgi:hypothetical protein
MQFNRNIPVAFNDHNGKKDLLIRPWRMNKKMERALALDHSTLNSKEAGREFGTR